MFASLAELASGHPRRTLILALVFVVIAGVLGGPVAGKLTSASNNFEDPSSSSVQVRHALERAQGANPNVSLIALVRAGQARAEQVAGQIAADPAVARVLGFFNTHNQAFVARGGGATYLAVSFRPIAPADEDKVAKRIEKRLQADRDVTLGGALIAGDQVGKQVGKDLGRAELLAFPILFVLSLVIFRGLVAALLPLLGGAVSIVSTFLGLRVVNSFTPLSIFALNLVTGLGLGLAIDYSLFVVSRYREELARGASSNEALRRTLATAGRTVLFSSLTVAAALASLLIFPQPFLYSMGIGGVFVALLSAANALIVLPAMLAALGPRLNAFALRRRRPSVARSETSGFWYRLAQGVMRRPGQVAILSAALLIAVGAPFLRIAFTGVDASVLPRSASARQVADALANDFPPNRAAPIYLQARGTGAAVASYRSRLPALAHVAAVSAPQRLDYRSWRLDVVSTQSALARGSKTLVTQIRALKTPLQVKVGGETAEFLDLQASLGAHLPYAGVTLAATTLVLLFLMTGSLILPLKTLAMNLLTLSATFGLLVLIFQDGRLEGVLDYTSQHALESTQPILLAAVAFALSTDYAVFLLTRIKEARDAGLSNSDAVAFGLERSGRIVTAAALLFCVAIGAFATSKIVFIKEVGVGTALAVIIDATIVRALLVPSLMKLLGGWNWWAPAPLRRFHTRLGISETDPAAASRVPNP